MSLAGNGRPWVTLAFIAACIGIFLSIVTGPDAGSMVSLERFGVLTPREIRAGAYYSLFASVLVHVEVWHIGMNMYALWLLGSLLEPAIGSLKYLAFLAVAAFASSIGEFALGGNQGIGASGVVFAIFGFMWVARPYYAAFQSIVHDRNVKWIVGWLFLCIPLTYLGILPIANGAHFGGILFGMGVAALFVRRYRPALVATGLVLLLALPSVTLFWCPWSLIWLADEAHEEHNAGNYDEALRRYGQVIEMDPGNGWAYANRSLIYSSMGEHEAAERDRERAETLGEFR